MTTEPTRYTMLPIQEDLVEDAMTLLVRWMREDRLTPWDAAAIDDLYEELDDHARSLLTELARASLHGEPAPQDELARRLGLPERVLLGVVAEVNAVAARAGHPRPVLVYQAVAIGPDNHLTERATVIMERDAAEVIGSVLGITGSTGSTGGGPASTPTTT